MEDPQRKVQTPYLYILSYINDMYTLCKLTKLLGPMCIVRY
jgi:hypothetical protein